MLLYERIDAAYSKIEDGHKRIQNLSKIIAWHQRNKEALKKQNDELDEIARFFDEIHFFIENYNAFVEKFLKKEKRALLIEALADYEMFKTEKKHDIVLSKEMELIKKNINFLKRERL